MNDTGIGNARLRDAYAALHRGDRDAALLHCRELLAHDATSAPAWALLGTLLRPRDPENAEIALDRALGLDPRNADALFHLGNLHREQRRFAAAIGIYEQALALAPDHPSLLNNLGLALEGSDDHAGAQEAYRKVLARDPQHPKALFNLAHLLCRMRRYDESAALCTTYLQRWGADNVDVLVDYGICQHQARDYAGAEASFRDALALAPGDPLILTNLGSLFVDIDEYGRAEPVLAQAHQSGASLYAASLLAYCRAHLCAWDGLDSLHQSIAQAIEGGSDEPVNAFAALSTPMSAAAQLRVAQRWARDLAPVAPAGPYPSRRMVGNRKVRLGYVSSDFGTHPIGFLLAEVWERHDRSRFDTFAYAIGPRETSPLRARIERAFGAFADCSEHSVAAIAQQIRNDDIDLLIDLNGFTTHARSEIFAYRPARVQLTWLGYLGTLGAPWYDYAITDNYATAPELESCFSERLLRLPHCLFPSDTRREIAPVAPSLAECGLPEDGFVFCCFNNPYKILPSLFDTWMRILAAMPGSVLWLSPTNATASSNLRREADARGIAPERLVFAPRVPLPLHLARHIHADLFIDTVPYNAGTTANDALFMGLPVLTVAGATMAGRVAGSQLRAIGLPELVVRDLGEYEALALSLAQEPLRLADCRRRLAINRATHPLFDMARFVAGLEARLLEACPS